MVIGAAACLCGIFAQTILSLLSKAYSFAGAGVVPVIAIGLLWRERKESHEMGRRNSKVTPWGARCGIVVGAVASQLPVFGDYAVIAGVLLSSAIIVIVSLLTKNVPVEKIFRSEGNVNPIQKGETA